MHLQYYTPLFLALFNIVLSHFYQSILVDTACSTNTDVCRIEIKQIYYHSTRVRCIAICEQLLINKQA